MLTLESPTNPFDDIVEFVRAMLSPTSDEQRQISAAVRAGWQENFTGERSGSGQAWAQLKPFTILERTKRGYPGSHPILVQSRHMLNSLVTPGAADSYEDFRSEGNGWTLTLGTTDSKALKHELGSGKIPARPFIELSQSSQENVSHAIENVIRRIESRVLGA